MADLNNGTYWSEVDASNNSASPNGWPEGMMPSGVNDAARSDKGAVKRFWDRINPVLGAVRSGSVWTYSTSNASYPTAYSEGEVFSFCSFYDSAAGDQFAVNALGPKPIYVLRNRAWSAILAYDIVSGLYPQLVYHASLNAGAGGFALLNPWNPMQSNGTSGGTLGGDLNVNGNVMPTGNVIAGGSLQAVGGALYLKTQVAMSASTLNTGFTYIYDNSEVAALMLGGASPDASNYYRNTTHRFQDRGGVNTFLIVNAAGASVTGGISATGSLTLTGGGTFSTTGPVVVSNNLHCSTLTVDAALTAASGTITALTVSGGGTALNVSAGNLVVAGAASFGGGFSTTGASTVSNNLHVSTLTVDAGLTAGVCSFNTITLTGGGTALSVPSGNVSFGQALTVTGTTTHTGAVTITAGGTSLNVGGGITAPGTVTAGAFSTAGSVGAANATLQYLTVSGGGTALDCSGGNLHVAGSATIGGDIVCQNITANVQGYKPAGGTWAAISDARTKDADTVADYTQGLAAVRQLRPISYRYNGRAGMPTGRTFVGLVADDVLPVMPEMVGTITERLDPDDDEPSDILTLDATALLFALTNAVRELAFKVDALSGEPDAVTRSTPQPRPHRQRD